MKNKLLLTTALAGLVAVTSAHAETKVTGNLEQTFRAVSDDASNGAASTDGFGTEYNIGLSKGMELDNGMSAKAGLNFENSGSGTVADSHFLTIGINDAVSLSFAQDNGLNISGSGVPHISETAETVVGGRYDNLGAGGSDGHNDTHVRADIKAAGGQLTLRYVPNDGMESQSSGASTVGAEAANSAYDVIYKGSLGVDGLTVLAGYHEADKNRTDYDVKDTKLSKYGVSYNFGQFTVGAEMIDSEIDGGTANTKDEIESKAFGLTFAASDNLTLGLVRYETEFTDANVKQANDEEITMVSVGYTLGGLGFDINYAQADNFDNGTTDRDVLQIRTIQKF